MEREDIRYLKSRFQQESEAALSCPCDKCLSRLLDTGLLLKLAYSQNRQGYKRIKAGK